MKKNILITGGAKRIGRFLSEFFIQKGWQVCVHYNESEKEAQQLKKTYPHQVHLFQCNLIEEEACYQLMNSVYKKMGFIDVLINNASVFKYDDILTTTKESWNFHLNLNLYSPFFLSQSFYKLNKPKRDSSIINIIDQRVLNLTPYFMSYTLSKSGLWTITQTMALAMAPHIRVNAIAPGFVLPSNIKNDQFTPDKINKLPLEKVIDPIEICKTALYLAETTSITGQIIALDSGQHMGWSFPEKNVQ